MPPPWDDVEIPGRSICQEPEITELSSLPSVSTLSLYPQSLPSVSTLSLYPQSLPPVSTLSLYPQSLQT